MAVDAVGSEPFDDSKINQSVIRLGGRRDGTQTGTPTGMVLYGVISLRQ
jgi:hypothetical protein